MILNFILIILLLWFLGIIQVPGISINNIIVIYFNGRPITVSQIFVFFLILISLGVLPSPIRQIAGVIFILWILSVIGVFTVSGLPNLLALGIIIGLVSAVIKSYFFPEEK